MPSEERCSLAKTRPGKGEWKEVHIPRAEVIDDMLDKIEELRERVNELGKKRTGEQLT